MKRIVIMVKAVVPLMIILFFPLIASAKTTLPDLEQKTEKGSIISPESNKSNSEQAKEHFQKGLKHSQSGQLDFAILEYRKALELDPNLTIAYVNVGVSYIQKKEYDTAVQALKKAIQKDSKLKLAHYNLWWAYRQQGKYDQGIDELKKIIAFDPNDIKIYKNLGDSYLSDKKMVPEAIHMYSQGLAIDKSDVSLLQKLGKAYELDRQWDKAIEQLQRVVELDKKNLYNYLFLYIALRKSGKNSEAKEIIQKSLTDFRGKPWAASSSSEETVHLLEYLAGTYSEKDLLSSKNSIIVCQANYYIGMNYVFQNKPKEASQYFQQAIDTKINFISEYEYAKIELDRIQNPKK